MIRIHFIGAFARQIPDQLVPDQRLQALAPSAPEYFTTITPAAGVEILAQTPFCGALEISYQEEAL